jgi:hypothetical protein
MNNDPDPKHADTATQRAGAARQPGGAPAAQDAGAGAGGAGGNGGPPADQTQERRRSLVRILVTYAVTGAYVLAALYLIWFLTWGTDMPSLEVALGIFAGLSSVATGVIGFWFGNRKAIQDIRAFTVPTPAGTPGAGEPKTP